MSQQQARRPESGGQEPIKYGDVFDVSGQLAAKPITQQDAAAMQSAENTAFGQTIKGGPAAVMQSAAARNVRNARVDPDNVTDVVTEQGVSVKEDDVIAGHTFVTEAVGADVVGQYIRPPAEEKTLSPPPPTPVFVSDGITIGEALEATAISAGDKPVDQSDAAAIQAAEVRATGLGQILPGGVGADAQRAADINSRTTRDEFKTKIADVLTDASWKMGDDKPVTVEDAAGVVNAEARNKEDLATHPGGVAASMAAAAGINQETAFNITV
ncbi:late embryogenesis abundant protein D-34 [Ipomoea triloba]|uniref:late embryogenesis abundant protein D-34 n=1 Tax=Ipomoea triloba TaxID=35885 RepID=UPI00125E2F53|nr:late embryogenesis abundant protein D-34 [Ipomoea triloba]XP_031113393.1 late embryogenesis abundant protein D-34 [Ipomoea triloba]